MLNKERFHEIIKNFDNQKIAVIGDFMLDSYMWGKVERISPEAPVPVFLFENETFALGGAGNVSYNLAQLGAKVFNIGVMGNDEAAKQILNLLNNKNFNNDALFISDKRPTIRKTRLLAANQQLLRIDYENIAFIEPELEEKIISYIHSIKDEIKVIILSDYGKGTITPNILKEIIKLKDNIFIAIDPKKRNFPYYKGASIITPNHNEAEQMSGEKFETTEEAIEVGEKIIQKYNLDNLLITLGPKGMILFEKNQEPFIIPTYAQQVYDVTGAGDTVISLFALSIASGASLKESAIIANIGAGYTVSILGCAAPTKKILKNFIKKYKLL